MREKNVTLKRWAAHLEALGMRGIVSALLQAMGPLAPLGAGVLWVAQPALGLLIDRQTVAGWAHVLEDPESLARLSAQLAREKGDE